MSQKKRRTSLVFRWHRSLAILVPWRRGRGDGVLDSEVVLTKMKIFNNFHEGLSAAEDSLSTISMSVSEQDVSEAGRDLDRSPVCCPSEQVPSKPGLSVFPDSQLSGLFKFESEDSGVEMPSGADSPSTPTGSEQSFVVHSRESSRDSQELSTLDLAAEHHLLLDQCTTDEGPDGSLHPVSEVEELDTSTLEGRENTEVVQVALAPMQDSTEVDGLQNSALGDMSGHFESSIGRDTATEELNDKDTILRRCNSTESLNILAEVDLGQQPLKKSTTSASLDEYMEQCCRLSEAHQRKSDTAGSGPSSGLGYLEHICQLIEKIGQLQEHNRRLQRQLAGLQKEKRSRSNKEDYFLLHCHCGAASLAFQELKRHSRSEFGSLAASNGALSDLSTIPEVSRHSGPTNMREGEGGCHPLVSLRRKGLNRRSYTEGETRNVMGSTEALSPPHTRLSESQHPWGRVKELVKKSRLRNQSRLGLTSSLLKSSCPQLYRPDLGPVDLPRRNRNSMIALGHQTKLESLWLR